MGFRRPFGDFGAEAKVTRAAARNIIKTNLQTPIFHAILTQTPKVTLRALPVPCDGKSDRETLCGMEAVCSAKHG